MTGANDGLTVVVAESQLHEEYARLCGENDDLCKMEVEVYYMNAN